MAKGRKTGGRDIKKGEVRNPTGRPKLTYTQEMVQKALRDTIAEVAHLLTVDKNKAIEELNKSDNTLLHSMLAHGVKSKDQKIIDSFVSRLIGQSKQTIEQTNINTNLVDLSKLTDEELEQYERLSAKISTD